MTAHLPGGESLLLLNIPAWDMNWQEEHRFARELPLPAGTRLESRVDFEPSPPAA